ncbi:hypothetical protein [Amycolatopsis albispora]|uniref:YbaB/EbfC DNA-binding family protein n=1 Tax=Amycolatopsis albispora TaxID=1804986 RepID=A0A344KZX5_9PSEU|nr:hypothetical protein [Amycolatopsis albispora]AXB41349.1 hypothetical protein A4R43_01445 [Amycolatopsis albispora]
MVNDRPRRRVVQFGETGPPAEPTSAVEVVVDSDLRVTDVVLRADWRESVGSGGLGEALRTAANDALAAGLVEQPDHRKPETVTRELFALVDRDLERYERQVLDSIHSALAVPGEQGVNGRIEVRMSPGEVTEVTVDRCWADSARHTEIRAEALSAFQAAARRLASGGPGTIELPSSLARLRELAGDPAALRRQLGLS